MRRMLARMFCYKKNVITSEDEEHTVYNWRNTIPFIPPITSGTVIKVYDGDTITIASKMPYENSPMYRFQVRLLGIDSPELKSKNTEETTAAKIAQKALEELILNKEVILKNTQTEKYGLILANVYLDEICVNNWLLQHL
jgi:endonuclease YncB( thermonuclease family)